MQLELLEGYQPPPEEMQPSAAKPVYRLGDRVVCPAGEGRIYHSHSNSVWVVIGNVARLWDLAQVKAIQETAKALEKK